MIRRIYGAAGSLLTMAMLAAAATLADAGALEAQDVGLPIGTRGPDVALEDLDGNPVQLRDYMPEGKPALIEFFAVWCENCEALQPQLDRIQAEHGEEVSVVAVAVAVAQSVRRVKRHAEDHDPGYAYLWDADGAAVRAYKAPATSVVVILDADGTVVYSGAGADQDLVGEVEALLES